MIVTDDKTLLHNAGLDVHGTAMNEVCPMFMLERYRPICHRPLSVFVLVCHKSEFNMLHLVSETSFLFYFVNLV